jgi:hypothetical protein
VFGAKDVDPKDPVEELFIPVPLHVPPVEAAVIVIGKSD